MLSEILKIIPKLDNAEMEKMQKSLQGRFTKLAKGFGKGLGAALLGGGVVGAAGALLNKILNPLEEVQKAINSTLATADDLDTFAKQFHTTPGQMFNLESLAGAQGLKPEDLRMLMLKFQDKVTEARADVTAPSSVREFANIPDTAAAFFEFIQSLNKMTDAQKDFVQNEVFGARQMAKASEFLNTEDFAGLSQKLGLLNASVTTPRIQGAAKIEGFQRILETRRAQESFLERAGQVSGRAGVNMIDVEDQQLRAREQQTSENISGFQGLKTLQMKGDKITFLLEDGIRELAKSLPAIIKLLSSIAGSREIRGVTKKKGE